MTIAVRGYAALAAKEPLVPHRFARRDPRPDDVMIEILEFCARHGIASDVEVIAISDVNRAFDRTMQSDVKYRFVIDMASLKA